MCMHIYGAHAMMKKYVECVVVEYVNEFERRKESERERGERSHCINH